MRGVDAQVLGIAARAEISPDPQFMQSRFFAAVGLKLAARGDVTAPHPHPMATASVHRQNIDRMSTTSSCVSHIAAEMPAGVVQAPPRFPVLTGSAARGRSGSVTSLPSRLRCLGSYRRR